MLSPVQSMIVKVQLFYNSFMSNSTIGVKNRIRPTRYFLDGANYSASTTQTELAIRPTRDH